MVNLFIYIKYMNNLLYFNNNTPNYEYILKDIIIDNNLSNLENLFTKEHFNEIFISTKNNFIELLDNFKKNNIKIIYNNCDYKIKYELYCDNIISLIEKINTLFDNNFFNFKYINCCPSENNNKINYFSFNSVDKSFKKEFHLQGINLYFNKKELFIYMMITNSNKTKRFNLTKPICINNDKIKKNHFNQLVNYINNLEITNITNYIFQTL